MPVSAASLLVVGLALASEATNIPQTGSIREGAPLSWLQWQRRAGDAILKSRRYGLRLLYALLAFQLIGAFVFVSDLWSEVLGLRSTPIPYEWQEIIQILASVSLITGAVTSTLYLRNSQRAMGNLRRQMDAAAGNFKDHLDTCFAKWSLSPSECAVAIYAMKGFSNAEVAEFRGTSASTVKSQMNSIYKKSGFANRQQLISFLVEDLLAGVAVDC
jgi:DNA-binding CsgD family transcriptional regulator